jgi:hypothetical protein
MGCQAAAPRDRRCGPDIENGNEDQDNNQADRHSFRPCRYGDGHGDHRIGPPHGALQFEC